jgi:hypothetical protein
MNEQIKGKIQHFRAKGAKVDPVDYVVNTYYTPLAESHRELINIIENYRSNFPQTFDEVEIALSNAKKLINERP